MVSAPQNANWARYAIVGKAENAEILLQMLSLQYRYRTFNTLAEWQACEHDPLQNVAVYLTWQEASTETLMDFTDIVDTDVDGDSVYYNRGYDTLMLLSNFKGLGTVTGRHDADDDIDKMSSLLGSIVRSFASAANN
jgi:hypothetical protein